MPQFCTRFGRTITVERRRSWAMSESSHIGNKLNLCKDTRPRENTHLKRTEPAWAQSSWHPLQQLGIRSQTLTGQRVPLSREEHPLASCVDCSSFNVSHTPYQGDSGQPTLRKNVAGIHIKHSLTWKTLGTHSLHRDWWCSVARSCMTFCYLMGCSIRLPCPSLSPRV